LKTRWLEAEPIISSDLHTAVIYATDILRSRWPEIEQRLLELPDVNNDMLLRYHRHTFNEQRWYELEIQLGKQMHQSYYLSSIWDTLFTMVTQSNPLIASMCQTEENYCPMVE
jgi:hypothetical protein